MKYSIGSLALNALSHHRHWGAAWRTPTPKPAYDVLIIGGGGHGLATAYYLAKEYGITNIAVLEKGWLGGGNTGRNTTVVRSNYLYPESARFYDFSLKLYEGLSRELNFNIMLSQRGWVTLAHSRHDLDQMARWVNAMSVNGIDSQILSRDDVRALAPRLNFSAEARFPILGGFIQRRGGIARHDAVAWGYARAADRRGVDIIQNCEVTAFQFDGDRIAGVETTRGAIKAPKIGIAVAGHSSVLAAKAGFRLPIVSYALQAMVSEPIKPALDCVVLSPATGVYVNQSDKGEIVVGGALDHYASYAQRGNFPGTHDVVAGLVEMFPTFSKLKLMRQWAGIVDVVHDSSPIIGPSPVPGLYLNCGWGTGGFKAIPAGGFTFAHTIATGDPHPLVSAFGLNRFTSGHLIDEAAASGIAH